MQETVWDFDMMQASDIVLTFLQSVIEDLYFGPFSPFFPMLEGTLQIAVSQVRILRSEKKKMQIFYVSVEI